jgi:hypothetical protein
MNMIIGQILGILATIIGICSFQVNKKKLLLLIQSVATTCTCLSYLFLGATSGFALNIVCLLRNGVFFFRNKGSKLDFVLTGAFMVLMGYIGALSWQGPISLFVIVALIANTFFMCLGSAQSLRYSILVTSTMVLIYNIKFIAVGGIFYESFAIVSSVIGILRFRKDKKEAESRG